MSKRVVALVAGAVALLLSVGGCSTAGVPVPSPDSPPTGVVESDAGSPEMAAMVDSGVGDLSTRGARPWKVGERIQLWGPPMAAGIGQYVTVNSITPVSSCPGKAIGPGGETIPAKPENGRFMAIDVTIENTAAYDSTQPGYYAGTAQQYDFVGADGRAVDDVDTTVAFYCTGKEAPFSQLKPGRSYRGTVNVDVPTSAGFLILGQSRNTGPGFEFELPAG
ncbi:hypothetical protein [Pseudonocardia sp.]|uniref:hypothetical protein n=1 Tax=Pseudonocardia sp. TaxID=60912 RepID=UPI003D0A500F